MFQDRVESEVTTATRPDVSAESSSAALLEDATVLMHSPSGSSTDGVRLKQAGQKDNTLELTPLLAVPKKYQPPTVLDMMEENSCTVNPTILQHYLKQQVTGMKPADNSNQSPPSGESMVPTSRASSPEKTESFEDRVRKILDGDLLKGTVSKGIDAAAMKRIEELIVLSSEPHPLSAEHWRDALKNLVELDPASLLFKLKREDAPATPSEHRSRDKGSESPSTSELPPAGSTSSILRFMNERLKEDSEKRIRDLLDKLTIYDK